MGKTRDLFKKIRDTKGTFHAKMGSIKDRNGVDLTEAEDIKKRWQECTEELYKKDLHDPDNHNGVIIHLEPDTLECEVKWALESITMNKASGGDGISVELFQILKDDAMKVLHSICQQIGKTQQWPQDWKRSGYRTVALISHASKVMLKILQARLQQYVNRELPDVQAGFRKGRGTTDQIANIRWIMQKAREFQKNIYFCFIDYAKAFDCVDHNKLWNILKEMGIPDHLTCLLRNLYAGQEATVRTGHGTTDWFQIGKGVRQGCILSPCLFNFYAEYIMRNAGLEEAQAGIKIAGRNINNLRYADDTTLMAESEEELKSLLMKVKEESEKVGLKLNIQKTKIMASGPITSWEIDGKTVETVSDFVFLGSKITADADCSHEIKRRLLLGRKVMTNLDSILKSRDITLPTKVRLVKAMVFPVVMYGCESWTLKKADRRRIDAFELKCCDHYYLNKKTEIRDVPPDKLNSVFLPPSRNSAALDSEFSHHHKERHVAKRQTSTPRVNRITRAGARDTPRHVFPPSCASWRLRAHKFPSGHGSLSTYLCKGEDVMPDGGEGEHRSHSREDCIPRDPAQERGQRGAGLGRAEERPPARPRGRTEPTRNQPELGQEPGHAATLKVTASTGGASDCAFLPSSQVRLMRLAWGPHFENHYCGGLQVIEDLQLRSKCQEATGAFQAGDEGNLYGVQVEIRDPLGSNSTSSGSDESSTTNTVHTRHPESGDQQQPSDIHNASITHITSFHHVGISTSHKEEEYRKIRYCERPHSDYTGPRLSSQHSGLPSPLLPQRQGPPARPTRCPPLTPPPPQHRRPLPPLLCPKETPAVSPSGRPPLAAGGIVSRAWSAGSPADPEDGTSPPRLHPPVAQRPPVPPLPGI
ncbi:uncharacterized protein LOC129563414 [Moschus berezovskii]|uniref:uncharacterized protein LOC129563414 n=1 Tax=Moschus berezovskii TaxID=68408 RepID=UPI0024438179|nr:uncharacterized protein LOC129563414 [Moschus berezovskii]